MKTTKEKAKWKQARGGLEDPPFLGVSSFVLQFVSSSYHTHVFLP